MIEKRYPIISIYPTIQGQGPRMGEPMTLVRTSTPPQFTEFCYMKSTRKTKMQMMTIEEIVHKCVEINQKWVFFGGDDPCISIFDDLADALHEVKFKIWLDTTGVFWFDWTKIDHLSVGPKPGLPFFPQSVSSAKDVRLYWRDTDEEIWLENFRRVEPFVQDDCPIFIAPRVLNQKCVDSVIKFVLQQQETRKMVRADIPLFRTLPNFDRNFNRGEPCPLCHLLDKSQGVEVKSCLEGEDLDIPEPYGKSRRNK